MLTVITGGMFAEKSTELQRRGRRLERAGKKVGYFKPDFDTRYSENELVTHDGEKVPAINVPTFVPEILMSDEFKEFDVFLIDEIQFFGGDVVPVIVQLLEEGKVVIVAGLDLDAGAKTFVVTAILMSMAEEVVKLHAVCSSCGSDAWVSYKEPNGKRIQLGTDEYTPLCRKCFYQKLSGGNENGGTTL
ncbi:thymidine kinase [Bacillus spizizenii]|nr:thymidine kinase [Bacillus spizizenii]